MCTKLLLFLEQINAVPTEQKFACAEYKNTVRQLDIHLMQDLYCTGQDIYTETGQDTEDLTSPALMVVSPLTTTCQYVFVNIASKKV